MTTRPEPTEEQLRAAWARERRDTWPATFEEAMADALLSRLVRLYALHPPRSSRAPLPLPASYPPPLCEQTAWQGRAHRVAVLDRKRAAAGDRDDD